MLTLFVCFLVLAGMVIYLGVFIVLVSEIKSGSDKGITFLLMVMSLGLIYLFHSMILKYFEILSENIIRSIDEKTVIEMMTYVIISIIFSIASIFSVILIKANLKKFVISSPSHKAVIVAITISLLFIGICFMAAKEINGLLNFADNHNLFLMVVSVFGGIIVFSLYKIAIKAKASFFFETILLTIIPCFCWFARLKGEDPVLALSIGGLLGGLLALGLNYVEQTTDEDLRKDQSVVKEATESVDKIIKS